LQLYDHAIVKRKKHQQVVIDILTFEQVGEGKAGEPAAWKKCR